MIGSGWQTEGTVKVSDEVIAVCAVNATLKTEGVAGLSELLQRSYTRSRVKSLCPRE